MHFDWGKITAAENNKLTINRKHMDGSGELFFNVHWQETPIPIFQWIATELSILQRVNTLQVFGCSCEITWYVQGRRTSAGGSDIYNVSSPRQCLWVWACTAAALPLEIHLTSGVTKALGARLPLRIFVERTGPKVKCCVQWSN